MGWDEKAAGLCFAFGLVSLCCAAALCGAELAGLIQ
jgi:hypothetical protein